MMGKRKIFNCLYCMRPVTGRHHAIALRKHAYAIGGNFKKALKNDNFR